MNVLLCQEQKLFCRRFKGYMFIKMYELSKWWVRDMIGTAFDITQRLTFSKYMLGKMKKLVQLMKYLVIVVVHFILQNIK